MLRDYSKIRSLQNQNPSPRRQAAPGSVRQAAPAGRCPERVVGSRRQGRATITAVRSPQAGLKAHFTEHVRRRPPAAPRTAATAANL